MPCKLHYLLISSILLISTIHAHKCGHDHQDKPDPIFHDVDEANFPPSEERILTSTTNTTYPNIRMKSYYAFDNTTSSEYQSYFANNLLPPILSYFQAALKVKYPMTTPIKFSTSTKTVCGETTPAELYTGVNVDFYYMFALIDDTTDAYVASSYACYLSSGSKRPYVAITTVNTDLFSVATDDVLLHERNMICIMHELTHTLGFSSGLFKYFLDSNGNLLTGHVTTQVLDGLNSTVINVEPLTTRLRNFFGCTSLIGAYMENDGSSGTAGSHFERRQFAYEAMTSGLIYEMQYSQFSLAMLEGSGWYVPDYSYADPFFFGQGQGCNFLLQACNASTFSFSDMCTGTSRGCAVPGRGGSFCSADSKSDGCAWQHPDINYDCENSGAVDYARLPTAETYGRGADSKCFTGTLTTAKSASTTSFCFKFSCSGSGSATVLSVNVGSQTVACNAAGTATVKGYNGVINCPDPLTFCNTVGQKVCPRGCMGQGLCVNGVCQCNSGFTGEDCALSA